MNIEKFKEGMQLIQNSYNKKLSKEQLSNFYENLKDMSDEAFINNIKQHIKTNRYLPTVADLLNAKRNDLDNLNTNINFSNINLDSSYWYENLKIWCEQNNKPYFDINTGKPLQPYKN